MIGPDPAGLGGISRVARIWKANEFFTKFNIMYIPSVSDHARDKKVYFIRSFLKYMIHLSKSAQCIYVHTSSYNSFRRKLTFIAIAILLQKNLILHIHPTHFYSYLRELSGIEKFVVNFIFEKLQAVIVLTEDMKLKLNNLFPEKTVYILPNAVDIKRLRPPAIFHRKSNSFLYLGWYIKEKGVYELVDAIEILVHKGVEIKIEFCGTKDIEKFKSYVIKKGLEDRITVNGWVNGRKKIEMLYTCTALILPSHSEGIPNVILEAMATKTPIIATHVGGLKAILNDRENAIIALSQNVKDLSEKLKLCLEDSNLRETIAENAYMDAKKYFDVEIVQHRLKRILTEIE